METKALNSRVKRSLSSSAFLSSVVSRRISIAPIIVPSGLLMGAAEIKHHLPLGFNFGKNYLALEAENGFGY